MNPALLSKHIDRIVNNDAGEPDLYAYIKELLTRRHFTIDLDVTQVVVDTKIDDSRRRPDLVAYKTIGGKPARGPDYAHAVFEVKLGDRVATDPRSIFRDKRAYIQPGTAWFFLIDQTQVVRIDCRQGRAAEPFARGLRTFTDTWTWDALSDPDTFFLAEGTDRVGIRHRIGQPEPEEAHEGEPVLDQELRALVRQQVAGLEDQHLEHEHEVERRATTLRPVRVGHGTDEVGPEQLEVDDAARPLQRVALGREILQTLIDVEKTRLTAHRSTSPTADTITPRNPSNREVFGGGRLANIYKIPIWSRFDRSEYILGPNI